MTDFWFCLVTILYTYLSQYEVTFQTNGLALFLALYGGYFQNVLIKTSTWLVVVLALYRHAAVSFPVAAKQHLTAMATFYAVITCFVFWILFYLPLIWMWKIQPITCHNNETIFNILPFGEYGANEKMKMFFNHSWTVVGFILPVVILAYCNVRMIYSLRVSLERTTGYSSPASAHHQRRLVAQRRMTITLITIVLTFFVLVFPSELSGYIQFITKSPHTTYTMLYMVITFNALQNINMAINFVLYCAVNSNFRKTLRNMVSTCDQKHEAGEVHV